MKLRTLHKARAALAVLSLSLAALCAAWSQSADEFFHRGAQHYLAGTNDQARLAVTNGLRLYPNDPRLTNLLELLNRKGGQQQQQQQSQENQDQNNSDSKNKESQQPDQDKQKKEQQKQDEEKKKEEQKAAEKKKKEEEEKQDQQGSPDQGENPEDKDGSADPGRMVKMTPQQAMQLLDMLKSQEKAMPFRPVLRTNRNQRVFKDW